MTNMPNWAVSLSVECRNPPSSDPHNIILKFYRVNFTGNGDCPRECRSELITGLGDQACPMGASPAKLTIIPIE